LKNHSLLTKAIIKKYGAKKQKFIN